MSASRLVMTPKSLMDDQREPRSIGDECGIRIVESARRGQSEPRDIVLDAVRCVPLPDRRGDQPRSYRGKQLADEGSVVLHGGYRQVTAGRGHAPTSKLDRGDEQRQDAPNRESSAGE